MKKKILYIILILLLISLLVSCKKKETKSSYPKTNYTYSKSNSKVKKNNVESFSLEVKNNYGKTISIFYENPSKGKENLFFIGNIKNSQSKTFEKDNNLNLLSNKYTYKALDYSGKEISSYKFSVNKVYWDISLKNLDTKNSPEEIENDFDGDGFSSKVDCDDFDSSIHPDATEICGDGIDQDCDKKDLKCESLLFLNINTLYVSNKDKSFISFSVCTDSTKPLYDGKYRVWIDWGDNNFSDIGWSKFISDSANCKTLIFYHNYTEDKKYTVTVSLYDDNQLVESESKTNL